MASPADNKPKEEQTLEQKKIPITTSAIIHKFLNAGELITQPIKVLDSGAPQDHVDHWDIDTLKARLSKPTDYGILCPSMKVKESFWASPAASLFSFVSTFAENKAGMTFVLAQRLTMYPMTLIQKQTVVSAVEGEIVIPWMVIDPKDIDQAAVDEALEALTKKVQPKLIVVRKGEKIILPPNGLFCPTFLGDALFTIMET